LGRTIWDNRGMGRHWLPLTMAVLFFWGCAPSETPRPAAHSSSLPARPPAVVKKPPAGVVLSPSDLAKLYPAHPAKPGRDEFDLPLVIDIETPEVPPEIKQPLSPTEQKPDPSAEKPNPLRLLR
jgi:hypothetical protein